MKFFIVPLKLLDTLHKHGYNVECKIVWCRSRVLKIHRIGLQGFKPQSKISKEKYFSFRLWRKDSSKWGISPKDWRARRKICNDGLERYVWKTYWKLYVEKHVEAIARTEFSGLTKCTKRAETDKFDKFGKYGKNDKFDKYDKFGKYDKYGKTDKAWMRQIRQIRQNEQRQKRKRNTKDNCAEKRVALLYFGLCRPYI